MAKTAISFFRLNEQDKLQLLDALPPGRKDFEKLSEQCRQLCERVDKQDELIVRLDDELKKTSKKLEEQNSIVKKQEAEIKRLLKLVNGSAEKADASHDPGVNTEKPEKKFSVPAGKNHSPAVNLNSRDKSIPAFIPIVHPEKEVDRISDSWEEIFASIDDGTYKDKYKIGNYKYLDFGHEGIIEMQIAGFDAEPLADGSGKAPITWIARNILHTRSRMNPKLRFEEEGIFKKRIVYGSSSIGTGSVGGWKRSNLRKYLEKIVLPLIDERVRNRIKKVKKYTMSIDFNIDSFYRMNEETEDQLWIPSAREVFLDEEFDLNDEEFLYGAENRCLCYRKLFSGNFDRTKSGMW